MNGKKQSVCEEIEKILDHAMDISIQWCRPDLRYPGHDGHQEKEYPRVQAGGVRC